MLAHVLCLRKASHVWALIVCLTSLVMFVTGTYKYRLLYLVTSSFFRIASITLYIYLPFTSVQSA